MEIGEHTLREEVSREKSRGQACGDERGSARPDPEVDGEVVTTDAAAVSVARTGSIFPVPPYCFFLPCFCPFWIFAQVSLRVTVRLNTGLPSTVSGSTQK